MAVFFELLKGFGPTVTVLLFVIWLLIRERRAEKNGNGTDKTTVQSLATTQQLMAHTIGLIEENGSVPFQVYVAKNEERYKNINSRVESQGVQQDAQSDRMDIFEEGQQMVRHVLTDVVMAHNRIHPDAPLMGAKD